MIKMKRERPNKDKYYLGVAEAISKRGTCLRRQIGAVIVNNDHIISTGYVGAPRGVPNCCDLGICYREKNNIPRGHHYEKCRSVHAEANAIIHASREVMSGGTIYIFARDLTKEDEPMIECFPCMMCRRLIINAGIKRVVTFNSKGEIKEKLVVDWINESINDPYKEIDSPDYN